MNELSSDQERKIRKEAFTLQTFQQKHGQIMLQLHSTKYQDNHRRH